MINKKFLLTVVLGGLLVGCTPSSVDTTTSIQAGNTAATTQNEARPPIENTENLTVCDNNMYSSFGRVCSTPDATYLWELSADQRKQILYSISNDEAATPKALYEMKAYIVEDIGYLSCGHTACYGDTLIFLENDDLGFKGHYVTTDGSDHGVIGSFQGRLNSSFPAYSQVGDKVYFVSLNNIIYEVDIKNRTMSEYKPGITVSDGNEYIVIGVKDNGTYYLETNKDNGLLKVLGVFCLDTSGKTTKVADLPEDTYFLELVGNYIIYFDGYYATNSLYSIDITSGEKYKLFDIEGFDLYFNDGGFHVADDYIYYLKSGEDLYGCTIKGEDHKLLIADSDKIKKKKHQLASSGDYLFYKWDASEKNCFIRIKKDGTAFETAPVIQIK